MQQKHKQAEESRGWVKLHRRLADHPRFRDPDWTTVWVYLLLNATHAPYRTIFDGRTVELRPGQLITGRLSIAENTGVHPSKVYRVLETLKIEHQIEQQAGAKSSIITVLNWHTYQNFEQQTEQQPNNKRAAAEHIQEHKEQGEQKEEESIYALYPRKVSKADALKAIRKALKKFPAEKLLTATKIFAAEWQGHDLQYCPYPATWFNGERFSDDPATWKRTTKGQNEHTNPNHGDPGAWDVTALHH
jgi:hypothetical protein